MLPVFRTLLRQKYFLFENERYVEGLPKHVDRLRNLCVLLMVWLILINWLSTTRWNMHTLKVQRQRLWAAWPRNQGSISSWGNGLLFNAFIKSVEPSQPSIPRLSEPGFDVKLTSHLHLVPKERTSASTCSIPVCFHGLPKGGCTFTCNWSDLG
jgi:hypothetical protein